jgi:hypothetical protein
VSEAAQPDVSPAVAAAAALVGDEAEAQASEQAATQETQEASETIPSWEADTAGIEDILGTEEETTDEVEEAPAYEETDEYEDDSTRELKKLQKQLAWEREQRIKLASKNWVAEAKRRFPLSDPESLQADSRRAMLREAKSQHERTAKLVKPLLEQLKQQAKAESEQDQADTRQAEVNAWGRPSSGPPVPAMESVAANEQLDRRKHRTHLEMTRARMKHDPNFLNGI